MCDRCPSPPALTALGLQKVLLREAPAIEPGYKSSPRADHTTDTDTERKPKCGKDLLLGRSHPKMIPAPSMEIGGDERLWTLFDETMEARCARDTPRARPSFTSWRYHARSDSKRDTRSSEPREDLCVWKLTLKLILLSSILELIKQ